MKSNFKLETVAVLENLAIIADFIKHSMNEFGLDEKKVFHIQLAVDEACSNIMLHGYSHKKGKIHINCYKKEKQVLIVIINWGKSWDPESVKKPDLMADLEKRKIGGMGLYFIKTLMDKVTYQEENGKNILTMLKSF